MEGVGLVRRFAVLAGMLLVVGLMFWAGVHNLRARRALMEKSREQIVLVKEPATGSQTADASTGQESVLQGKMAPGFTLVDLNGKKVSLADFKGHPVVLNFWATWCGPCRLEMPWFEEFYGKYKGDGLVVLGLSQDDVSMPKEQLAAAAKKIGVTYPILMPDDKMAKVYSLADYLPETFYVDKNGIVVDHTLGTPSKDELEEHVKKAMGL